jgi:lipoprotein-anchoring transpeptidase ErfK/SrfK
MDGDPAHTRSRTALAGMLGLIPVVPILAAIVISAGGTPAKASDTAAYIPANLQASSTSTAAAAASGSAALPSGSGSLVAVVRRNTQLRAAPGGRTIAKLPTKTTFGSPQVVSVVKHTGRWLGVVSSLAGNGRIGWVPRTATSLSRVPWELKVSLSDRHLTVLKNGKTVERYTVAVGRPTAPTPSGRFAVTDRLNTNDPSGPYGCCILALSALSPHAIQGWSGGNRIAIHSTPETSTIGQPVSHGCVRLTIAEGRWLLAHIPLGTPTLISS